MTTGRWSRCWSGSQGTPWWGASHEGWLPPVSPAPPGVTSGPAASETSGGGEEGLPSEIKRAIADLKRPA